VKKYYVKKQWRAVGACEFDVFFRDTKAEIGDDIVGEPEEVWAVLRGNEKPSSNQNPHEVMADCYCLADARKVCRALQMLAKGGK
jgi:hypothetical protein